jgi:hypothetical protein
MMECGRSWMVKNGVAEGEKILKVSYVSNISDLW